jgi:predicted nucleic acid-binding protein
MGLIYLDYNCFQRGFDDPQQVRIQMEALACQEIFTRAEQAEDLLVWSFMHEDETILCPFPERQIEAFRLSTLCKMRLGPEEAIYKLAQSYSKKRNLSAKDAVHLACAVHLEADFFLTCDDKLLKQARKLRLKVAILNPVDFIRL